MIVYRLTYAHITGHFIEIYNSNHSRVVNYIRVYLPDSNEEQYVALQGLRIPKLIAGILSAYGWPLLELGNTV